MKHWERMYQRPPLATDALLFAAAVLLHLPLLLLSMKAPPKLSSGQGRYVNVNIIEQFQRQVEVRLSHPAPIPPVPFPKSIPAPPAPPPPAAPLPTPKAPVNHLTPPPAPVPLPKTPTLAPPPALSSKTPFIDKVALTGSSVSPKLTNDGGARIATASRPGGLSIPGPNVDPGKKYAMTSRTIATSGIGGGNSTGATLQIPVTKYAVQNTAVLSPRPAARPGAGGPSVGIPEPAGRRPDVAASTDDSDDPETGSVGRNPSVRATSPTAVTRRPAAQRPLFRITGPLKDRRVLSQVLPEYPEWAQEQGIEARVVLQFTVLPDGRVKENVQPVLASGYPALEALAKEALLQWVFAPLPDETWREEVGTIEMKFSVH